MGKMGKNIKAAFGRSSFSVCTVIIKIDKMKNKACACVCRNEKKITFGTSWTGSICLNRLHEIIKHEFVYTWCNVSFSKTRPGSKIDGMD